MSKLVTVFEVRRKFKSKKPVRSINWNDGQQFEKVTKMFHIEATSSDKAEKRSRKYGGEFVSCEKANISRIIGNIENLPLGTQVPIHLAIARDELLWQKKEKQRERLRQKKKDKGGA